MTNNNESIKIKIAKNKREEGNIIWKFAFMLFLMITFTFLFFSFVI